jgi:hypothetical protein
MYNHNVHWYLVIVTPPTKYACNMGVEGVTPILVTNNNSHAIITNTWVEMDKICCSEICQNIPS